MKLEKQSVAAARFALDMLDTMVADGLANVSGNPEFEERLRGIHKWAAGKDEPPKYPDVQATAFYGLVFLGAAHGFPAKLDVDAQVAYKRLYFRQIISHCRYDSGAPKSICDAIDAWMKKCNLHPKYDWIEGGREVLTTWTPGSGTLFFPLAAAVEQAARTFLEYPDSDAPEKDFEEWAIHAGIIAGMIAMQHDSPYHGAMIGRIIGCMAGLAERSGHAARIRKHVRLAGKRVKAKIPIEIPEDINVTIHDIEIDLGLRAEEPKPTAGWRERRKAKRMKRRGAPR